MSYTNEKLLSYFTVKDIQTPKEGHTVFMNRWWALSDDDMVIMFDKYSPQCNADKTMAEVVSKKLYSGRVVFIENAYIKSY